MSSYRLALTSSAEKELQALPKKVIARIVPRLEHLVSIPRPPGCKKLKGGDGEFVLVTTGSFTSSTTGPEPST